MERGYLKLWRRSLDSETFHNPELWRLWTWCLMKTSYKQRFLPFHTGKGKISVKVEAGQFIFGRNRAAEFLGDSPSTVWKRMKKLELLENIKIESNKQYSIVTICNWEEYQEPEEAMVTAEEQAGDKQVTSKEQLSDNRVTAEEQLSDTNKKVKKDKNVKEVNEKDITPPPERPDFISPDLWKPLLANRKFKKLQNTELALKVFCNAILVGIEKGYTAEECVGEFVSSSWKRFNVDWMNGKTKPQFESWDQPAQQEKPKTKRQLEALRLLETL